MKEKGILGKRRVFQFKQPTSVRGLLRPGHITERICRVWRQNPRVMKAARSEDEIHDIGHRRCHDHECHPELSKQAQPQGNFILHPNIESGSRTNHKNPISVVRHPTPAIDPSTRPCFDGFVDGNVCTLETGHGSSLCRDVLRRLQDPKLILAEIDRNKLETGGSEFQRFLHSYFTMVRPVNSDTDRLQKLSPSKSFKFNPTIGLTEIK